MRSSKRDDAMSVKESRRTVKDLRESQRLLLAALAKLDDAVKVIKRPDDGTDDDDDAPRPE